VLLQNVLKNILHDSTEYYQTEVDSGFQALEELMPGLEHKYCVKHLHANLKMKGFKGKEYKDALWGAAKAPNEI
jgi:hypothetical protein